LLLLGFVAAGRAIRRALTRAEWPRRRWWKVASRRFG